MNKKLFKYCLETTDDNERKCHSSNFTDEHINKALDLYNLVEGINFCEMIWN